MARSVVTRVQLKKTGNLTIQGYESLMDRLDEVLDQTRAEALKGIFFDGAKIVRDQAKANAPYDPGRKKGTHLRDAIFAAPGKADKPNALVGVSRSRKKTGAPPAYHGLLIEYGTTKMSAKPFMRPAITSKRGEVAKKILDGIEGVVTGAWRK